MMPIQPVETGNGPKYKPGIVYIVNYSIAFWISVAKNPVLSPSSLPYFLLSFPTSWQEMIGFMNVT